MCPSIFRIAALALELVAPVAGAAQAQSSRAERADVAANQVTTIYDRVSDSTRVTLVFTKGSRPFRFGSRAWLDVSFAYPGRYLTVPPETVVFTLESITPARRGWAFDHTTRLHAQSGTRIRLDAPAAQYMKQPGRLFDVGRRELLSFHISAKQFAAMATEPELELKADRATFRFGEQEMDILRDVVRRMTPPGPQLR